MQLRVPNQYKPSFLENILSTFLPVPTKRILSDKKIIKQRKINLSLTDDKKVKSNKKIAISSSLTKKQISSASTDNQKCIAQKAELNKNENRGLNFRPRKITFQNEQLLQPKIKNKMPFFQHSHHHSQITSGKKLTINRKRDEISQQKSQQLSFKDAYEKNSQLKYQYIPQNNYYNKSSSNQRQKINLQTQFKLDGSQKSIDSKLKDSKSISLRYHPDATKISNIYTSKNISTPSAMNISSQSPNKYIQKCFKDDSQILKKQNKISQYRNSYYGKKPIEEVIQINQQSKAQIDLQTPCKQKQKLKIMNEPDKNNYPFVQLNKQKFITNLFEKVNTIQSKFDESSSLSSQNCFSNVIERVRANDHLQNNNSYVIHKWKRSSQVQDWDELRRKSLHTNLIKKFQQNQNIQQLNKSENPKAMNFKKKKIEENENYQEYNKRNIKCLEDMFINSQSCYDQSMLEQKNFANPQIFSYVKIGSLQPKRQFYDQFTKINYLGVGRFANVYFCVCSSINFIFAVKQILKFTVMCNRLENQVKREIDLQHSCSHVNIISLYHAWSDQKKYYLALQYGQQTLLNRLQKQYIISETQCIKYIHEIAKGLEYLHNKNIIHRDIKPQNIIIVNGVCKIADFGWCIQTYSQFQNQPCGTPCYISPQMQHSLNYTFKTDCWSLGVLAYEIINGKLDQKYFQKGQLNRKSLQFKRSVSKQYKELVYRMLAIQQQERPTISQILKSQIFIGK